MQLVNVRDRFITLEVTPEDCILLREACTVAREHLSSHTDHEEDVEAAAERGEIGHGGLLRSSNATNTGT